MAIQLLKVIEAVHAAGPDPDKWPAALSLITALVGGVGATLEVIDRQDLCHREFFAFGVPTQGEIAYLDQYAPLSPRIPAALKQSAGELTWDNLILNEREIDRSPFYAEFLASMDMRYAVAGILKTDATEFAAFAVQRSGRQGHVDRPEIAVMRQLLPHVSQALDVTRRFKRATALHQSFAQSMDWLSDGFALLGRHATILYANAALESICHANDGIRIRRNCLEIASQPNRLNAEVGSISTGSTQQAKGPGSDFLVPRQSGAAAYVVSIRPVPDDQHSVSLSSDRAVAMAFIRNPAGEDAASVRLLRNTFELTAAEASLARAIQLGQTIDAYAKAQGIRPNTVYSHLRRIKEKTGYHRMAQLVRKLNELTPPAQSS